MCFWHHIKLITLTFQFKFGIISHVDVVYFDQHLILNFCIFSITFNLKMCFHQFYIVLTFLCRPALGKKAKLCSLFFIFKTKSCTNVQKHGKRRYLASFEVCSTQSWSKITTLRVWLSKRVNCLFSFLRV